jgi:hypothetical protein
VPVTRPASLRRGRGCGLLVDVTPAAAHGGSRSLAPLLLLGLLVSAPLLLLRLLVTSPLLLLGLLVSAPLLLLRLLVTSPLLLLGLLVTAHGGSRSLAAPLLLSLLVSAPLLLLARLPLLLPTPLAVSLRPALCRAAAAHTTGAQHGPANGLPESDRLKH